MARTITAADLPGMAPLDREKGRLSRQLAQQLRSAIRSGVLRPGERLPATRRLARSMEVARGTVVNAFEQLVAEGFLAARPGGGTVVSPLLSHRESAPPAHTAAIGKEREARRLPAKTARLASVAASMQPLPDAPFAVSVPTGEAALGDAWRKLGNQIRATYAGGPAGYGDPQGVKPLRAAIADYVRKSRSVLCDPGQVIITSGTQQGLYLTCTVLLGDTDRAWVENPAYLGISTILESIGPPGCAVHVPVDEQGLIVQEGIKKAPDARLAFVTPSHQYPLGMPMSMPRREALLEWARAHDAWIVEDDYDSELRYAGHPFPALQGLGREQVVYLGTFSKILSPSLRMGYLIAPHDLIPAFCGARILMDRHAPTADQHVLAAYIAQGRLDRRIRRIRTVYAESRACLIGLLRQHLPKHLAEVQPRDQGAHLLVALRDTVDDAEVAREAARQGVAVRALSPAYAADSPRMRRGLILGFGGYAPEQMAAAARKLGRIVSEAGGSPSDARACKRYTCVSHVPICRCTGL